MIMQTFLKLFFDQLSTWFYSFKYIFYETTRINFNLQNVMIMPNPFYERPVRATSATWSIFWKAEMVVNSCGAIEPPNLQYSLNLKANLSTVVSWGPMWTLAISYSMGCFCFTAAVSDYIRGMSYLSEMRHHLAH